MYIAPTSIVKILKNIPLDNTYKDTLYFANEGAQSSYFLTQMKVQFANYTYIRKENKIRVEATADTLFNCNYIMWQNPSFGAKWFYAFIIDVEYLNNETAEITFEIDEMQTWYFGYTIKPSFIERNHTVTDVIGDNLVPDNLELGEYVFDAPTKTGFFRNTKYIVAATFDKNLNPAGGAEYMGVYSGLVYNIFDRPQDVTTFIDEATADNKSEGIIGVFIMPADFITNSNEAKLNALHFSPSLTNIDGYVPKNKKLFTYPYNFINATNNIGNEAQYRYEFFTKNPVTGNCEFSVIGGLNNSPEFILVPNSYKGVPMNYNEMLVLNGLPVCSFSTDTFKAWWAQNSGTFAAGTAGKAIGLVGLGLAVAGGPVTVAIGAAAALGGVLSGITTVAGAVAEVEKHATMPPRANGVTNANILWAAGAFDFFLYPCHITQEFAKIIDDFWSMYGYPIHEVGIPNLNARPQWNYVKLSNPSLVGSIPVNSMKKIKQIFIDGVTFWKNPANVGRYDLPNEV